MADEKAPQTGDAQQQQGQAGQRTIRLTDEGVKTLYANVFSVIGDQDDIMLMFGTQFGNANVIRIHSKIVVNARNAKRIALSLAEVIRRYEAIGVDQLIYSPLTMSMEQRDVLRSIDTFGRRVLPLFDREPSHRTTRQREAALAAAAA